MCYEMWFNILSHEPDWPTFYVSRASRPSWHGHTDKINTPWVSSESDAYKQRNFFSFIQTYWVSLAELSERTFSCTHKSHNAQTSAKKKFFWYLLEIAEIVVNTALEKFDPPGLKVHIRHIYIGRPQSVRLRTGWNHMSHWVMLLSNI